MIEADAFVIGDGPILVVSVTFQDKFVAQIEIWIDRLNGCLDLGAGQDRPVNLDLLPIILKIKLFCHFDSPYRIENGSKLAEQNKNIYCWYPMMS